MTVASVDTGVVGYTAALLKNWFNWNLNPSSHVVILVITLILLAIQTFMNSIGAKVLGRVAQVGVCVEIHGTVGIAIVLAIHGFHHGLGYLFSSQGVQNPKTNPLGLDFHGSYLGALVIAVLAPVYIFYGFESAVSGGGVPFILGQLPSGLQDVLLLLIIFATTRRSLPRSGSTRPQPLASLKIMRRSSGDQ